MERIKGLKICVGEPIVRGCDIIVSKAEIQSKELFEQDNYALEKATKLIRQFKPDLLIINLPGVDSIGETYGPMSGNSFLILKMLMSS